MRAEQFNEQVQQVLEPLLSAVGFKRVGSDFVRQVESAQLVLFRFGGSKYASLIQFTRFALCFRHSFLRDLSETVPSSHPTGIHEYPFRTHPTDAAITEWSYRFELNPSTFVEIEYGKLSDASSLLREIGECVATKGIEWGDSFTPTRALELLKTQGSDAWCEKLWIKDYNARKRLCQEAGKLSQPSSKGESSPQL